MNENENIEIAQVQATVDETNKVSIPDAIRAELVRDLSPVADRLEEYETFARIVNVANQADADRAAAVCDAIAEDIATVKGHKVLSGITSGLHELHRKWTGLRDRFVGPLERDRRTIKQAVIAWQEAEKRRAAEIQRKLQAEADERARKEAEKLAERARKAEEKGQSEKAAALEEQAEAVAVAPTITVAAPKTGMRVQKVWTVKNIDLDAFFRAAAKDTSLRGYVELKQSNMVRAKAANNALEIPGVVFDKQTR